MNEVKKSCNNCGKELKKESRYCDNCGCNVSNEKHLKQEYVPSGQGIVSVFAIIFSILGAIGLISGVAIIIEDMSGKWWGGYSYMPPYTNHELTVLAIVIISFLFLSVGLYEIIKKK